MLDIFAVPLYAKCYPLSGDYSSLGHLLEQTVYLLS
jgi:hypothetical protein